MSINVTWQNVGINSQNEIYSHGWGLKEAQLGGKTAELATLVICITLYKK